MNKVRTKTIHKKKNSSKFNKDHKLHIDKAPKSKTVHFSNDTKMEDHDSVNEIGSTPNSETEDDNISLYSNLIAHSLTDDCVISDFKLQNNYPYTSR